MYWSWLDYDDRGKQRAGDEKGRALTRVSFSRFGVMGRLIPARTT